MKRCFTILFLLLTLTTFANEQDIRHCLEQWNLRNIGIREATGNNDGVFVEHVQGLCNMGVGVSWCACYVNAGLLHCGVDKKNLPWSPAWSPAWERTEKTIYVRGGKGDPEDWQMGDMFLLYYQHLARVGHIGFVGTVYPDRGFFYGYEGNATDSDNEFNPGQGVHGKRRKISQVYKVVDYITGDSKNVCRVKRHQVNKKETLYRIAIKHKTTVVCINEWNPQIKNNIIYLGQWLVVNDCNDEC